MGFRPGLAPRRPAAGLKESLVPFDRDRAAGTVDLVRGDLGTRPDLAS